MILCNFVKSRFLVLGTSIILNMTGCSSSFFADSASLCVGDNGVYKRCGGRATDSLNPTTDFNDSGDVYDMHVVHSLLPEYAERLAMQLVDNMHDSNEYKGIAIEPFVQLDKDSKYAERFGQQFSEVLYTQLQKFNLNLNEPHNNVYGNVDYSGSSSSMDEPVEGKTLPFDYVLKGTWFKSDKGIMVNARIVGLYNKTILSTASTVIPEFVLTAEPRL